MKTTDTKSFKSLDTVLRDHLRLFYLDRIVRPGKVAGFAPLVSMSGATITLTGADAAATAAAAIYLMD